MDEKKKQRGLMGVTFTGAVTFNGPMFDIHDNAHVHIGVEGLAGSPAALTASDRDIQAALEELLKARDEAGEPVFRNKKQWWAAFAVLKEFCNYPPRMSAFIAKMKEIGFAETGDDRGVTYDSLAKAGGDVPKMATCSASAWGTLKDISENYRQQYAVADFLMLRLGIKS